MTVDWAVWSVVRAGLGRLNEVRDEWTLEDLFDAHDILNAEQNARMEAEELP